MKTKKPPVKCKFCGVTGYTKMKWRGSRSLDIFLWCTLLIPGPLYTLWRWAGRKEVCRYCESENFEALPPEEWPDELKANLQEAKEEEFGYEEHRF